MGSFVMQKDDLFIEHNFLSLKCINSKEFMNFYYLFTYEGTFVIIYYIADHPGNHCILNSVLTN